MRRQRAHVGTCTDVSIVKRGHLKAQGEVGGELPSAVEAGGCWAGPEGLQRGWCCAVAFKGLQEPCCSLVVAKKGLGLAG